MSRLFIVRSAILPFLGFVKFLTNPNEITHIICTICYICMAKKVSVDKFSIQQANVRKTFFVKVDVILGDEGLLFKSC